MITNTYKVYKHALDVSGYPLPISLQEIFCNRNKNALEIGFGEGEFLLASAQRNPEINYLGLEVKTKRFKKAVKNAFKTSAVNLKFIHMEAFIAVNELFAADSFHLVYINFPDPWSKDRHRKHRIITHSFLNSLSNILIPDGIVEIASDHKEYILHILDTFESNPFYVNSLKPPGYTIKLPERPVTGFESEFREQGKEIYFLKMRNAKSNR